jgi:hypothetical protein
VTLLSKTLPPAQEAEITRKLDTAARLDFPEFQRRSLKSPAFRKWFKGEYGADPIFVSEKITPDIRAAFMVAWARDLREQADVALIEAELAAADDDAPEDDDGEDIGPDLPLIRTRAPTVRGDDGERETRTEPADAPTSVDAFAPIIDRPDYPYPGEDDPGVILLDEWCRKFRTLSEEQEAEWIATHVARQDYAGPFLQTVYLEPLDGVTIPSSLADFESYTETVRCTIGSKANRLKGRGLSDVQGETPFLVPDVIPLSGATLFHGHRKHAKSSYAHKLVACITSDALTFDGVAVPHGPVLYVSADSAARLAEMSARFSKVCRRLGVPLPDGDRLSVVDSPMNLTDPAEVETFINGNPGPWSLVVIDPLYRCVGGRDLLGVGVANDIDNGCARIGDAFGCPVLILHHDTKDGKTSYGTGFIEAGGASAVQFMRHHKGNVLRDLDPVTVTVEWLKNGLTPESPFKYRIEGAYLAAAGESVGRSVPGRDSIKRADVLDALETDWTPRKGLRAAINGKLAPDKQITEKQFERLRKDWQAAGLIEEKRGSIRRVLSPNNDQR